MNKNAVKNLSLTAAEINSLSPMMKQYLELKESHHDCIVMFRLGDFYEMFFDDAILVASELGLTLTGRDCGLDSRAPMCGVPHHSVEPYINRLVKKGYRIALCEQLTDPALSKGIVERGVVRIITPGTMLDSEASDSKSNNFLLALMFTKNKTGFAYCDVSTGSFRVCELTGDRAVIELKNELARISPGEVILPDGMDMPSGLGAFLKSEYYTHNYSVHKFEIARAKQCLLKHFNVASLAGFGVGSMDAGIQAAGALMQYLNDTQKNTLEHITSMSVTHVSDYMRLDDFTRRNLELIEPIHRDAPKSGTLLSILDNTYTAMGGRLIKAWITQPLLSLPAIEARLDAVEEIKKYSPMVLDSLKGILSGMCDIERLTGRLAYGMLTPKQCLDIKNTLFRIYSLQDILSGSRSKALLRIKSELCPLDELRDLINSAIAEEPQVSIREGGIIRGGFDKTVDDYRSISENSRAWLSTLEEKEREQTGIKGLRIGYNRVFGYYFEVTKSNIAFVPERFVRKQTLTNCERYFTDELKEIEEKTLSADEKCAEREYELYCMVTSSIKDAIPALQRNAALIARLDVYFSFAQAAVKYNYVRPSINTRGILNIQCCRHPVVERTLKEPFNPNDISMNMGTDRLLLITGPNMAGKSTYMRQTALAVLMAHIGSYVPALNADIALTDRIFTRVGASDSLSSGQSTFMVEMSELASILNAATEDSLIILDEIGRGTATYDGLSIAWAVVEYIINTTGAKTMFATHYHELISLEETLEGIKNYSVSVKEIGDDIIFLHKIVPGGADRSFGIQVASLAGLPESVVRRAKLILHEIETKGCGHTPRPAEETAVNYKTIAQNEIYNQLSEIDPNSLSPMESLKLLYELHNKTRER